MASFFTLRGASFFARSRDKVLGHAFLSLKKGFLDLKLTFLRQFKDIRSGECG